jgi:hypothetical protein
MTNLSKEQTQVSKQDLYITKEQFNQYLNVQRLGLFNMLSEQARDMTNLTKVEFKYIIKHYDYLKDLYINH